MKTPLVDTNFVMGSADRSSFVGTDSVFDYDVVIRDPEGTSATYEGAYRGNHLVAFWQAGKHTTAELAAEFGVARSTIYRAAERAGISTRTKEAAA